MNQDHPDLNKRGDLTDNGILAIREQITGYLTEPKCTKTALTTEHFDNKVPINNLK